MRWLLLVIICIPQFGYGASTETVRSYWQEMVSETRRLQPDAQIVWVFSGSNVNMSGSVGCVKHIPATGWIAISYSSSTEKYFRVSICEGNTEAKESTREFPTPPKALKTEFIDTNTLAKVVRSVAKRWKLTGCHFNPTLRMVGGEPTVDATFPKGSLLWQVGLDCGEWGGYVFIEGRTGAVLKATKHKMKGDD